MSQAKGVLPTKGDDREVLYKNPRSCGYFVGVALADGVDQGQLKDWIRVVDGAITTLVAREAPSSDAVKGQKVASVAVGFGPRVFTQLSGDDAPELPVGLRPE